MAISHTHTNIPQFTEFFDPADKVNFTMNWAPYIGTSSIATSLWTVAPIITIVQEYIDGQTTTVIVSGMSVDETYEVSNTITTDDIEPLRANRSFKFTTKDL